MNKKKFPLAVFGISLFPKGNNKLRYLIGKSILNYINYILIIGSVCYYMEIGLFTIDHSNYNDFKNDLQPGAAYLFLLKITSVFNLLGLPFYVGNFILACSIVMLVSAFIIPWISLVITGIIAIPVAIIHDVKGFYKECENSLVRNIRSVFCILGLVIIHISTTGVISILSLIFIIPFILIWKGSND